MHHWRVGQAYSLAAQMRSQKVAYKVSKCYHEQVRDVGDNQYSHLYVSLFQRCVPAHCCEQGFASGLVLMQALCCVTWRLLALSPDNVLCTLTATRKGGKTSVPSTAAGKSQVSVLMRYVR